MSSDLGPFTYANRCSVVVMHVLGDTAPCDCCCFRRDVQSINPASSRVFSLEHAALFSLRLLDLALNIISAAVEFSDPSLPQLHGTFSVYASTFCGFQ